MTGAGRAARAGAARPPRRSARTTPDGRGFMRRHHTFRAGGPGAGHDAPRVGHTMTLTGGRANDRRARRRGPFDMKTSIHILALALLLPASSATRAAAPRPPRPPDPRHPRHRHRRRHRRHLGARPGPEVARARREARGDRLRQHGAAGEARGARPGAGGAHRHPHRHRDQGERRPGPAGGVGEGLRPREVPGPGAEGRGPGPDRHRHGVAGADDPDRHRPAART